MSDIPPLDPHLRAALQHAPDASIEPPAALDERILRAAQNAANPAATGARAFPSRLFRWAVRVLDAARAPVPAAALGSLALATVVVALWGPGWPSHDEPLPRPAAPAAAPASPQADAAVPERKAPAAAPAAPGGSERQALSSPAPAATPASPDRARLQGPAAAPPPATAEAAAPAPTLAPPPTPAPRPAPGPAPSPALGPAAGLAQESLAQRSTEAHDRAIPEPAAAAAPVARTPMKTAPPRLASAAAPEPRDDAWALRPRDAAPEGGRPWRNPEDGQTGRLVVVDLPASAQAEVWWIPDSGLVWRLVVPADQAARWRDLAEGGPAGPPGPWPPAATASAPR